MAHSFTFTTDDAEIAQRIVAVILPSQTVTKASKAATEKTNSAAAPSQTAAATPFPSQAAPAAAFPPPAPAAEVLSAPAPASAPPAIPTDGTSTGAPPDHLSQAIAATNAQMDVFLKSHKAGEAKQILQKYGIKRVSDAIDPNVLFNIFKDMGGQA